MTSSRRAVSGSLAATPAVAFGPGLNANVQDDSPDPETLRIREDLQRLRDNTEARRAFYDELHRTVERVRAGVPDEEAPEQSPVPAHPATDPSRGTSSEPSNPPFSIQPRESRPHAPGPPQASAGTGGRSIDRAAYQRVVRWAKANGAPVPLALGVAWMESHLHTYPPRGAAGEVGMFQIMPARCKLEGWPSRRLKEPEFNAWLGTRLLARYYQEEGSWARAAAQYVAGPQVFRKSYSDEAWAYINWYASSVNSYAGYFSRYQS